MTHRTNPNGIAVAEVRDERGRVAGVVRVPGPGALGPGAPTVLLLRPARESGGGTAIPQQPQP